MKVVRSTPVVGDFSPRHRDSEVIAMSIVAEFQGIDTDKGIWQYFRRHMHDSRPRKWVKLLQTVRRLIETVIGQLCVSEALLVSSKNYSVMQRRALSRPASLTQFPNPNAQGELLYNSFRKPGNKMIIRAIDEFNLIDADDIWMKLG